MVTPENMLLLVQAAHDTELEKLLSELPGIMLTEQGGAAGEGEDAMDADPASNLGISPADVQTMGDSCLLPFLALELGTSFSDMSNR